MSRTIAIGEQYFQNLRQHDLFYVDKTKFIEEWWNSRSPVTLITRPRRFGKTLMLDTVNTFFSQEFAGRSDLFEGLEIWKEEKFHKLQGRFPVIFLSFARINDDNYSDLISRIKTSLASIYGSFSRLIDIDAIPYAERGIFTSVHDSMTDDRAKDALHYLCKFIKDQHNIKPIILLDEYDTPFHAAWINKYWDKLINFMHGFFNATFKDNPYLERGLIIGITRVAKESIFSDMNNLDVVGTTSSNYTDCFGFTEQEVFSAMDQYGMTEKEKVRQWYDGFIFGRTKGIYNPWSIINYLKKQEFVAYWANTSSNKIVGEMIIQADEDVKEETMELLKGKSIEIMMEEEIAFSQLDEPGAIWSFLTAAGYLKPISFNLEKKEYTLTLTNHEVHIVLNTLISNWFKNSITYNRKFIKALLSDNLEDMNINLNHITKNVFSFFDTSGHEPERFYHGFVLGLIVDLKDRYAIKSNRESGEGRYDVMMFPKKGNDKGIIIEFKTLHSEKDLNLEKTCKNALKQIREKRYVTELTNSSVNESKVYVYGFGFMGKNVLICGGCSDKIDWKSVLEG